MKLLTAAIDKCKGPVWLASPEGIYYNMKSMEDRYDGLAKWIHDTGDNMEIFTGSYEDEAVMMGFWMQLHAA